MLIELRVEMDDGTTYDVVADQRDVARWEIQDFGCPIGQIDTRMHLAYRWLAWSALTRRQQITLSWPDFDRDCVEVIDPPDADEGTAGDVDPGQPAPSALASSPSPGAPVNR
ncbi:hypothetical protein ABT023_16250 [Micromonospora sp. NPDC002296]|uniref:hypothetical protein n=1 Tax=Micromonospora sp. NPDC002296 TaxID=3154271 RepID=UPI003326421F